MEGFQTTGYVVDIVLCIDGTMSMAPIINKIKLDAKNFYMMYANAMQSYDPPKPIRENGMRVKVIVFRDFKDDGDQALVESPFYNLQDPSELNAFNAYVDAITPSGGGDYPENALEAIAVAMKSQWAMNGNPRYRRQAILVFTDNCALQFNHPERISNPCYPRSIPKNAEEFIELWGSENNEMAPYYAPLNGRLIIFAPESTQSADTLSDVVQWRPLADSLDRVWFVPMIEGGGCAEQDLNNAMDILVGSF